MIGNRSATEVFTKKEFLVIKTLINSKSEICGFNEFDAFPSPEALAKTIENTRTKVRNLGINVEVIKTVRGKGYIIV